MKICIIGFGKAGSHLYYTLRNAGYLVKTTDIHEVNIIKESDIIFIVTQDNKIKASAKQLSELDIRFKRKAFVHLSGSLNSDELKILKKKGAHTASFHPVQTFEEKAKKYSGRFRNIFIAIEGDEAASKLCKRICKKIGAQGFKLNKNEKKYHHACCVMMSGLSLSLIDIAMGINKGGSKNSLFRIYKPLMLQTINNIERKGIAGSLSGPVERNDRDILQMHMNILSPEAANVYRSLSANAVKLALIKKSINKKESELILKTLNK
jgi:predicted short-subunit dehydrogenase-like oxidoreductase (DUF2520 family)